MKDIHPHVLAVMDAWNKPGINPEYHRRAQAKLRREWPTLARALDRLSGNTKRSN